MTPNFRARNGTTDIYSPRNKPGSIIIWMDQTYIEPNTTIIIMDPDM